MSFTAADYEKLGAFYLGRPVDSKTRKTQDVPLLYDSRDLTTHAVCIGMTGSGKTGLCLALLEEAAIDGVPAIIIDPKGDLTNLALTFPELRGSDFEPWVLEEDATRAGLDTAAFAAKQAEKWKTGLASWGQDGERIRKLKDAVDLRLYTPGSTAGVPVRAFPSFQKPGTDSEQTREHAAALISSLLALGGVDAEAGTSREHVLLTSLVLDAWEKNKNLELADLLALLQKPPIEKLGVLDVETMFPAKDRFALVMKLNNLLASPDFAAWREGEPLDVGNFLRAPNGKPRISVFTISHLSDTQRMFFVSLLLQQIVTWMRRQPGTTSLRALIYMDEIFGYFPPVANPPSKAPLLTLLKQARAFGIGTVLSTQNPVDLDYKGLANAGTWLVGRLQTDRDKAKVLEALETLGGAERPQLEAMLNQLGNRVFLLHNVHESAPQLFETRWAMSYLRGPLTRDQIRQLSGPAVAETKTTVASVSPAPVAEASSTPPTLPPGLEQYFLPTRSAKAHYEPLLLGATQIVFADAKLGVNVVQEKLFATGFEDTPLGADWTRAEALDAAWSDLESAPSASATFAVLPAPATQAKRYAGWQKDFSTWIYTNATLELFRAKDVGLVSRPDESERDFRARLDLGLREKRDAETKKLEQKFSPKLATLQERLHRAEARRDEQKSQANQAMLQTALSVGTTLLGAFMGRKAISASTLSRAATAARGVGKSMKERQDIGLAEESIENVQAQLAALDAEFKTATAALESSLGSDTVTLETITLRPNKTRITVRAVALGWRPV